MRRSDRCQPEQKGRLIAVMTGYWLQVAGGILVLLGLGRTWWVWSTDPVRRGTANAGRRIRNRLRPKPHHLDSDEAVVDTRPADANLPPPPIGENATPIDVALWAHEHLQHERRQREQIEQTLRASISAAEGRALTEVDGVRQDATSQLARHGRMIERAALGGLGAAALGGLLTVIGLLLQGAPGT